MNYKNRIVSDPNICGGKPTFAGTRITISNILDFYFAGTPKEELLKQFPRLKEGDLELALEFTNNILNKNYSFKAVSTSA